MKITIANLYYDLLNLYGDSGNIKALVKNLENQNIKVNVLNLSINDNLDFEKYDFVYIGSGTESNQKLALSHLMKYKDEITKYIENNKFLFATGNSIELFGKQIIDNDKINCLNIFNYESIKQDKRIVKECTLKCEFIKKSIIGFENHNCIIDNNKYNPMFKNKNNVKEGIHYKNFYATYLLGPILIRNTDLLKYIITKLVLEKDKSFKFKKFDFSLEEKAYDTYVKCMSKE